ncbi:MAG: hypothetical protein KF895_03110 [Parvibaculum sp.]|nr:hypothetical protein [Parvibaculum sp.]
MIIAALDLATNSGYAIGDHLDTGTAPVAGCFRLPKTGRDYGHFGAAFDKWLRSLIQRHGVEFIVYETPILPAQTQIETLRKLYSLGTIAEMVARDLEIMIEETDMQTVRKHFIGVTRAPKEVPKERRRAWMKARIIAKCEEFGWQPENDDEADALATLHYARIVMNKTYAANTAGPLLTGGTA